MGSKSKRKVKKGKTRLKTVEIISIIANIAGIVSCIVGLYQCYGG
jgi:hypothetical protein